MVLRRRSILKNTIPKIERISHTGNTTVPSIWTKSIVDVLLEISKQSNLLDYKNVYICVSQSKNRISFNRGYTENEFVERVFHLHLWYVGYNNELYFRDYLIEYSNVANKYEKNVVEVMERILILLTSSNLWRTMGDLWEILKLYNP